MLGHFYTQGLAEETKGLSHGVLDGREFWEQAHIVFGEDKRALDHLLGGFDEGFFFFYFSTTDQGAHMLWNYMDPEHPSHQQDDFLEDGIRKLYVELDQKLGEVMRAIDDDTLLVVMSDHGFAPFYWEVNLNSWLVDNGWMTLHKPADRGKHTWFGNVDWSKTKAYAAGINGLYLNLKGREKNGIVEPADRERVMDELERDLLAMVDPRNGGTPVTLALRPKDEFRGPYADTGPDFIVGYNLGYRGGWKTALGEVPKETFEDNLDAWSGDHAIDYRLVPGVLIANREITLEQPALYDLTVAILDEYGVPVPEEMVGRDCLGPPRPAARSASD
jgi:predicted AlkP superfamily phosphohydrolase/phosphomutase